MDMNYWEVLRGKQEGIALEIKFLEMELEFKICTKHQTQNYYNGSVISTVQLHAVEL
jgi:hypothetical protein